MSRNSRASYSKLGTFFIVGPTASGKSDLAANVAQEIGAEIVGADAFQIYQSIDVLTAKPERATLQKVPHHLIGILPVHEEMNAARFRSMAMQAIAEIHSRGKPVIVVGGSGLYIKALIHGLAPLPSADSTLREKLNRMSLTELCSELARLDPNSARKIDPANKRRVVRAIEICRLTGKPASTALVPESQRVHADTGVFVFRDRKELYARINHRIESMLAKGAIDEVRTVMKMSSTASQMIGLRQIRNLLAGKMSLSQCVAEIQQATRRYAKRQLTWFRRQTNFEPLNLSLLSYDEAVQGLLQRACRSLVPKND